MKDLLSIISPIILFGIVLLAGRVPFGHESQPQPPVHSPFLEPVLIPPAPVAVAEPPGPAPTPADVGPALPVSAGFCESPSGNSSAAGTLPAAVSERRPVRRAVRGVFKKRPLRGLLGRLRCRG